MNLKREILIVPDKFKESLSGSEVADAIEVALENKKNHIVKLPLADGGDGSYDVLKGTLSEGYDVIAVDTFDPLMRPMKADMLLFSQNGVKTAFIEMAKCCGLVLLKNEEKNPEKTTTFGLGIMLRRAIELGSEKIIVGIGGSSTNDGGEGMLRALVSEKLVDGYDERHLKRIFERVKRDVKIDIKVACDVTNPLLGTNGATLVYATQKGADKEMIKRLEKRMEKYVRASQNYVEELGTIPGGGAAGGVGAAFYGFLGADLVPGWKLFSEITSLEEKISKADIVITGEGRLDMQSLSGKLVDGISFLCRKYKKKLYVVCGENMLSKDQIKDAGIFDVFSILEIEPNRNKAISNARQLIEKHFSL